MVDNFLFSKAPHLFIIILVLVEDPFEVGHTIAEFNLFPYLPLSHYASNQVFVIVAIDHCEG